jgi:parallel beta-helix repeat protein
LDAESAYNTIKGNSIHVVTPEDEWGKVPGVTDRGWPVVAIDASTGNTIMNNTFSSLNNGGIYLYRNCGEGGTIRHTTPSRNLIINNIFYYNKYKGGKPAVYFGSRDYGLKERLGHCNDDDGRPYGSSASEKDYARDNVVMQNQFYKRQVYRGTSVIRTLVDASLADYVKTKNSDVNSPNYVDHNQIVTAQTEVKNRRAGCYLQDATTNFLLDGRSLDLLTDSGNSACLTHYSCTDGELPQSRTRDCRIETVGFSCQVSENNSGCRKMVACPSGKKLVGAKAACNLEAGSVSGETLDNLSPNLITVVRASDNRSAGSCHVGCNQLQSGQTEITRIKGFPSVGVGCKEHDENGGDCHIQGIIYCK